MAMTWQVSLTSLDLLPALSTIDSVSQFRQSRVVEGLFSRFVLGRVVRLTVETNLLTGISLLYNFRTDENLTFC